MPIYEYVCEKCGKKTEVIQSFKHAPPKGCPHCGGKLKKAFSAPAIQFKGSGFYITDYAGKRSEGGKKDSGEKGDGGEKAEKAEKSEASEKSDKPAKTEKAEKSDKADKSEKSDKGEKKKDKKSKD
ncbi:MAG: FmdB family zinc ribbon protein [Acidobacteriota bacterium]